MLQTMLRSFVGMKTFMYGVGQIRNEEDPYVAAALYSFNDEIYDSVVDYTKKAASVYEVEDFATHLATRGHMGDIDLLPGTRLHYEHAVNYVHANLTKYGKVEALSPEEAMGKLHLSTSAGYSFDRKKKGEVLDQILLKAKEIIVDLKDGKKIKPVPCSLASRGHLHHRLEKKRRVIFVYPAEVVLLEQMFVTPIYDLLKDKVDSLLYFGKNIIPRLAQDSKKNFARGSHSIVVDFSKFDTTVIIQMIRQAFIIVKDMIDFEHFKGKKIPPSHVKRWERVWEFLVEYFTHTPVITPGGKLLWIDGTVPSGSGFTQLIDSIVAMIAVYYTAGCTGCSVLHMRSLGDDVRAVLAQRPELYIWREYLASVFKLNLNEKKTKVRSAKILGSGFLGYTFKNGQLYRPDEEWFNLALHPERDVKDLATSMARVIAYMFLGGVNSLKFSNFFEYYQSCYDFSQFEMEVPKEMESKVLYAGWDIPIKPLSHYTMSEFVNHLITFK